MSVFNDTRNSTPRRLFVSMGSSLVGHALACLLILRLQLFLPLDIPRITGYQVTPLSTLVSLHLPLKHKTARQSLQVAVPEATTIAPRALHFEASAPQKEVAKPKSHLDIPELKSNMPHADLSEMLQTAIKQPSQPVGPGSFFGTKTERAAAVQLPGLSLPRLGSLDVPKRTDGTGGGGRGAGLSSTGYVVGPAGPRGGGTRIGVRTAGFLETDQRPAKPSPQTLPVEILWKPIPTYSDEARAIKLQGDVLLNVRFGFEGTIHVMGVKKGLGYGLDEAAISAVGLIRFKPALRDGRPIDIDAIVRVEFRLVF